MLLPVGETSLDTQARVNTEWMKWRRHLIAVRRLSKRKVAQDRVLRFLVLVRFDRLRRSPPVNAAFVHSYNKARPRQERSCEGGNRVSAVTNKIGEYT